MPRIRTLALILAGGAGGRLELLTHSRAKPAVPFAGTHRLIDFPLSNCHNAQIDDVWVSQQFNPVSLTDHLANGRPWDLDRTSGGLLHLHPREGNDDRTGFQQGTADVLWRNAELIREFRAEALVVVSADAVYKLDYGALVEEHREAGKAVTMVTTEVDPDEAGRYGVVQTSGGDVREYVYKPDEPRGNLVSNEVFVFSPDPVLDALDEIAEREDELKDLGHELLPRLVDRERSASIASTASGATWARSRPIGPAIGAGRGRAADRPRRPGLADPDPRDRQPRVGTPARGRVDRVQPDRAGRDRGGDGRAQRARAWRSVESGAVVRESVLLPGSIVRSGTVVERAILDDAVEIGSDSRIGEAGGEIAVIGQRATIEAGTTLASGARFPDVE